MYGSNPAVAGLAQEVARGFPIECHRARRRTRPGTRCSRSESAGRRPCTSRARGAASVTSRSCRARAPALGRRLGVAAREHLVRDVSPVRQRSAEHRSSSSTAMRARVVNCDPSFFWFAHLPAHSPSLWISPITSATSVRSSRALGVEDRDVLADQLSLLIAEHLVGRGVRVQQHSVPVARVTASVMLASTCAGALSASSAARRAVTSRRPRGRAWVAPRASATT